MLNDHLTKFASIFPNHRLPWTEVSQLDSQRSFSSTIGWVLRY